MENKIFQIFIFIKNFFLKNYKKIIRIDLLAGVEKQIYTHVKELLKIYPFRF